MALSTGTKVVLGAGAILGLLLLLGKKNSLDEKDPHEPEHEPAPTSWPATDLQEPTDAAVFARVVPTASAPLASPAPGSYPVIRVGEILKSAAADPLTIRSFIEAALKPPPSTLETVHAFTVDSHGTVLGSWKYVGLGTS